MSTVSERRDYARRCPDPEYASVLNGKLHRSATTRRADDALTSMRRGRCRARAGVAVKASENSDQCALRARLLGLARGRLGGDVGGRRGRRAGRFDEGAVAAASQQRAGRRGHAAGGQRIAVEAVGDARMRAHVIDRDQAREAAVRARAARRGARSARRHRVGSVVARARAGAVVIGSVLGELVVAIAVIVAVVVGDAAAS